MANFFREVFSEGGIGSAKRVLGAFMVLVVLGCTVYLCISEGATAIVEHLLDTAMIMGGTLLGISSVTSIFKKDANGEIHSEVGTRTSEDQSSNRRHDRMDD